MKTIETITDELSKPYEALIHGLSGADRLAEYRAQISSTLTSHTESIISRIETMKWHGEPKEGSPERDLSESQRQWNLALSEAQTLIKSSL